MDDVLALRRHAWVHDSGNGYDHEVAGTIYPALPVVYDSIVDVKVT
jgi:hypothetical protein